MSWMIPLINLIGLILAIKKRKEAFLIFIITNGLWTGYALTHKAYELILLQLIYFCFNVWGYRRWKRESLVLKEKYLALNSKSQQEMR